MAKKNRNNLSYVGENIKKIRQAKKLSQADFSQLFNLARASVGAYEEGRSEPKIETLIAIANYFSISIDALLTRRLTISEIFKFNSLNEKLDQVHHLKGRAIRKNQFVKLIRIDQYLNYIVQRTSRDYMDSLEEVGLSSGLEADIALEMNGGEMSRDSNGIHHGDILYAKQLSLDDLKDFPNQVMNFMTNTEILTRRFKEIKENKIILSADDSGYPEKQLDLEEVLECWRVIGVFTVSVPRPLQTEERLLRIEEELKRLKG